MNEWIVISIVVIILMLLFRIPKKVMRFVGGSIIRLTIATLLLFFLNVFGGMLGLHIPINIFTVLVSTVLGVFGIASLVAIHLFILT